MSDFPLKEQAGPSQEQLDAMKPVIQKFSTLTSQPLVAQTGVLSQKSKLANNLQKSLISYLEAKQKADMSKENSMDLCIKDFANELASIIVEIISAQAITVTTTVNTTVSTVVTGAATPAGVVTGTGVGTGVGTGNATPQQVTST